ncbi:tryptophan 2,3-dioxygenase [Streptomyces ruber]|uniref:Tryptophan 2,3-dioxygenase n=2 Tax=Streptomyces TaxID=1883 RepID=A0A918F014_9ACTN|nr:tryptophan 2,3-dioxygenase family protein [Streptomyces ruber]GGQ88099.1 tryptophan 2,3-dioxygenase [Streptomyces ruber]
MRTRPGNGPAAGPEPRDTGRSSDAERAARAASTGGCPALDGDSTPYIGYQSVDVLLSLQQPRSGSPAELPFYVMGQVEELLFKLVYEELCVVRGLLDRDQVGDAVWTLHRVRRVVDVMAHAWDVLGALAPTEFAAFRDHLNDASGLQSYMYRMVEFVLGNKKPALAALHAGVPQVHEQVERALREPSVYDAAVALLARQGAPIASRTLRRDPARPYPECPSVQEAWANVYREHTPADPVLQLAEALVDLAEGMSRWRALHLLTVERMIGAKPGTGGSSGVAWLRTVNEHRFFPELWSARSLL